MSNEKLDLRVQQVLDLIAERSPEMAARLKQQTPVVDMLRHLIAQTLEHADPSHAAVVMQHTIAQMSSVTDTTLDQTLERSVDVTPDFAPVPGQAPSASPE